VVDHISSLSSLVSVEVEHRREERGEEVGFLDGHAVLFLQDRGDGPVAKLVDVSKFTWRAERGRRARSGGGLEKDGRKNALNKREARLTLLVEELLGITT